MATRMQQRRGTEAQWTSANPVLAAGEIGFVTDTNQFKIGDGVNVWADLSYFQTLSDLGGTFDDYIALSEKAAPNGVATLNANGHIPVEQLQDLIDGAPGTLDTLNEIAEAITAVDGLVAQAIDESAAAQALLRDEAIADAVEAGIASEVTNRDAAIGAAIADEVTARDSAITAAVGAEADARDAAITQAISDEVIARDSAISAQAVTTLADAEAYADAAEGDANTYADSAVSTHNSDTTNVHGISDTSALATKTYADDAVTTHNSDTTSVHGIPDTSVLATDSDIQDAKDYADDQIDVHVAITTNVHGIADTTKLVVTDAQSQVIGGDVTISGNLIVQGDTTTINATDLSVSDPLIYMSSGNWTTDAVDVGFLAATGEVGGTEQDHKHSGLFRDVSDSKKWKLVSNVPHPTANTVDTTAAVKDTLVVGNLEADGVVFTDGTQTKQGVPSLTPIIAKTDSYTLSSLTERDSLVEVSKSTATTITIPADSAVNYPVGTSIDILQTSTGQVTIAGAAGVTVNATPGLKLRTQWSSATLFKRSANTWVVYGDLSA